MFIISNLKTESKKNPPVDIALFWSRVDRQGPNDCWLWQGYIGHDGYGRYREGGQDYAAHRLVWKLTHGDIPGALFVCHGCDNRACCNPAHLALATHSYNMADMVRKGRSARGSRNAAAKLTESDVLQIRELLRSGHTHRAIANVFGIAANTVCVVGNRTNWGWLQDATERRAA